ncbi:MAG: ribose-phosphate diphosphokinase [Syntrophobacteraceae bacterium]
MAGHVYQEKDSAGLDMRNRLIIFSCSASPLLTQKVCSSLGGAPGKALVGRFSDGEVRIEIQDNVRGKDVFIIQSTSPPVNENLIELLVMIDAVKRASPRRINVVIPYFGYGRQDQKVKPRVSISAKMVADLLAVAGADRIITIEFHADQIEGFFNIPVDHLNGMQVLLEDLKNSLRGDEIILAPDSGGVQRARRFAKRLNADLAIMDFRGTEHEPSSRIVGQVKGRRVIVLDDMVDTGWTIVRTAEAAVAAGADVVDACCVHALFSLGAVERLNASPLRFLTITDTVLLSSEVSNSKKIRSVSIAPLLAEAIRCVNMEKSVSSLFVR